MKNLSLATKIGILVAVLVISSVAITVVGVRQFAQMDDRFEHLIDVDSRALVTAEATRIDVLQAIRAEKNAVLSMDAARAGEFADAARNEWKDLAADRTDLAKLVGTNLGTREGKALSDFDQACDDLLRNQKEVLRLTAVKSLMEGRKLLLSDYYRRAQEVEDFVASLSGEAGATSRPANDGRVAERAAAGRAMLGNYFELLYFTGVHLDAFGEIEMSQLDGVVRARLSAFQDSVWRLNNLLGESDRARAAGTMAVLEGVKQMVTRVLELSHLNNDQTARMLTTTKTVEFADRCDAAMTELINSLSARLEDEKKNADWQNRMGRSILIGTAAFGSLIALALAVIIIRSITRPVGVGLQVFESLASGDLTRRMNLDRQDEIGRLGHASDQMAATLCEVVTQIRALAGRLGEAANDLLGVSHDLLSQSHEMATQAETVAAGTEQLSQNISSMAAAAEEMCVNIASISSASEQVSVNVGTISSSAESGSRIIGSVAESVGHITSSLQETARDAKKGSAMTHEARDMATAANAAMRQLDQAASDITKVTDVIKTIAIQTNLLALNATIEATSAGEAGRGFAVVAGEIKDLANQSGQSAEEIARKIESVQASTREAVKVIENVARSIGEINTSAGRISDAVGTQTETAGRITSDIALARKGVEDIARSIAEVAKGANDASSNTAEAAKAANDASRNAAEAATASQSIASSIHGVSEATRLNNASAVKVDESARRLKEIAGRLQKSVEHFNTGARPAATNDHG